MNVSTQYQTEAFMNAIGAPRGAADPSNKPSLTGMEHLDIARDNLSDQMTLNHELRHDLNMAAWHTLHEEAMARGDIDVATNIMTQKIIPNRS